MNPDRGSRYEQTDGITNIRDIRLLTQPYFSIYICATPPWTPHYTSPLNLILPTHIPEVYMYVYAIINSANIKIAVRVVTTSISLPWMRHLPTTSAATGISIFSLLPDFYLICLNFYNSIQLRVFNPI